MNGWHSNNNQKLHSMLSRSATSITFNETVLSHLISDCRRLLLTLVAHGTRTRCGSSSGPVYIAATISSSVRQPQSVPLYSNALWLIQAVYLHPNSTSVFSVAQSLTGGVSINSRQRFLILILDSHSLVVAETPLLRVWECAHWPVSMGVYTCSPGVSDVCLPLHCA